MPKSKHFQERRKHKRFFVKNRIFAVVRSKEHCLRHIENLSKAEIALALINSHSPRMGEILEISRGGLSFSYIDIENKVKQTTLSEMDILFAEKDFHLSRLPFKAVKDDAMLDENPFNAFSMKRMTVKFEELTPRQQIKIEHLLSNYTVGEVPRLKANKRGVADRRDPQYAEQ